ncbi:MAG TPA: DUF1311 domain-containing protein [Gammaproteobacteria bacterium]|nr:DUF1311 domain-containing protein [Gammaproteobacteria bacterium]
MNFLLKTILALCVSGLLFSELSAAASEKLERADALLAQTYDNFTNALESLALKLQLRDAQRAWIRYRDQICTFEVDYYKQYNDVIDSSALVRVKDDCLRRLITQRTRDIRGIFSLSRIYNSDARSRRVPSRATEPRALTIHDGNGHAINIEKKESASGSYSIIISPKK